MGQSSSLGHLNKKGQIAPAGAPASSGARSQAVKQRPDVAPVIGKRYPTYLYTDILASFPFFSFLVFILLPFGFSCVSMLQYEDQTMDSLVESFEIADHTTIRKRDGIQAAFTDWKDMLSAYEFVISDAAITDTTNLSGTPPDSSSSVPKNSIPWKRLYIQYKVKLTPQLEREKCMGGLSDVKLNLLKHKEFIDFMREVELRILRMPLLKSQLCFRSNRKAGVTRHGASDVCAPFTSLVQYYYPGELEIDVEANNNRRYFWSFMSGTGAWQGKSEVPDPNVLSGFYQNPSFSWYVDAQPAGYQASTLLRTQITLGRPVTDASSEHEANEQFDTFIKYFSTYMDKIVTATRYEDGSSYSSQQLEDLLISNIPENIEVSYGGDGLLESQLRDAMEDDWWFVFLGVIIVLAITCCYCHSLFLASLSICQLSLTYYTATFFHYSIRDEPMSLLSLLSFTIMMSMSTDGTMVFYNTFRQSAFMETNGRRNTLNVPQRLAFCFRKAGAAIAITHVTAASAFGVNTLSTVPAVKDFGSFMVVLCLVNLYMYLTVFPCGLVLHHYHVSGKRRVAQRQKEVTLRKKRQWHPTALRSALRDLDFHARNANSVPMMYRPVQHKDSLTSDAPVQRTDSSGNNNAGNANGNTLNGANLTVTASNNFNNTTNSMVNDTVTLVAPLQSEVAGAEHASPPTGEPADPAKTTVSFGGVATSRFLGLSKLQARIRGSAKRRLRTAEEVAAEHHAQFEAHSGAPPQRSRRKQAQTNVLRIPLEYTSLRQSNAPLKVVSVPAEEPGLAGRSPEIGGLHGSDFSNNSRDARGILRANSGAVTVSSYRDHVRAPWEAEAANVGIESYLGAGVFFDPMSQRRMEAAKKVATVAQCTAESIIETRWVTAGKDGANATTMNILDDRPPEFRCFGAGSGFSDGPNNPMNNSTTAPQQNLLTGQGAADQFPSGGGPVQVHNVDTRPGSGRVRSDGDPTIQDYCSTVCNWWRERGKVKRRFGRFGKRVGETREEKDRRIMSKRAKREGYTSLERFFYNVYTPALKASHGVILLLYFIKLLVFIAVFLSGLEATSEVPQLLDSQTQTENYKKVQAEFPVSGSCDYCGAYFRPYTDFPAPYGRGYIPTGELDGQSKANTEFCNLQMYDVMDTCGVCGGSNACIDCMGQRTACTNLDHTQCPLQASCRWDGGFCYDMEYTCPDDSSSSYLPGWVFDSCGTCYHPAAGEKEEEFNIVFNGKCTAVMSPKPNQCETNAMCEAMPKVGDCNLCLLALYATTPSYPPPGGDSSDSGVCAVPCDTRLCPPEYGKCDTVTGECVCHTDYIRGFFQHGVQKFDPTRKTPGACTVCLGSFYPEIVDMKDYPFLSAPCSLECRENATDPDCDCLCDYDIEPTEFSGKCMCRVCNRLEYDNGTAEAYQIPRPSRNATDTSVVAVGYNCTEKQRSRCDRGTLSVDGQCECEDDFSLSTKCALQESCNSRGKKYNGICHCHGCWSGDKCEIDACHNSGVCEDATTTDKDPSLWECSCRLGVWEGPDCSQCPQTCIDHSHCPLSWPTSLKGEVDVHTRFTSCWVTDVQKCYGYWTGDICDTCSPPASVPQWLRDQYEARGEVLCNSKGEIIGCDGQPATEKVFKWNTTCGGCGDAPEFEEDAGDDCLGCDGVLGSGKTIDSCGVCGGNGYCFCDGISAPTGNLEPVEFVWGIIPKSGIEIKEDEWTYESNPTSMDMSKSVSFDPDFNFADYNVQQHIQLACSMLYSSERPSELYVEDHSGDCFMPELVSFLRNNVLVVERSTLKPRSIRECRSDVASHLMCTYEKSNEGPDEIVLKMTFPYTMNYAAWVFFQFAKMKQKTDLIGFSSSNPDDPNLRVVWVRFQFILKQKEVRTVSRARLYSRFEQGMDYLNGLLANSAGTHGGRGGYQWSPYWIEYFTEKQASTGALYALFMSGAFFAVVVIIFSCSFTLVLLSLVSLCGIVIFSMSYMKIFGWKLGPPEQVGLTCLIGIAAEYTVHILEGYMEYIHATQSSLLARNATRAHAIAGTLQRTGVPIAVSAAATALASCFLLLCKIRVYRRVAEIMLMVTLFSAFHALVLFPCLLLLAGPITILCNWSTRFLWGVTVILTVCFTVAVIYLSGSAKDPAGDDLF